MEYSVSHLGGACICIIGHLYEGVCQVLDHKYDGGFLFLQVEPHHITEKIDSYIKDVSIESVGRSVQGFSWEGEKVRHMAVTLQLHIVHE